MELGDYPSAEWYERALRHADGVPLDDLSDEQREIVCRAVEAERAREDAETDAEAAREAMVAFFDRSN